MMKHWKVLLPAALLLSTLWFACRDQEYDDFQKTVDVAFAGRVIDEDGQPVEGAQVRAGSALAVTDVNGVFRTEPASLPARDAKLSITKIGYFDFSRAFIVQDDVLQTVTIQLLRKDLAGTFNAGSGGTVQVPGGVSLNFPAGSVNASGQVRVFAKYLDPTSPNLALQMPGDLRAINLGNEQGTLATFGMLGVELTDAGGQAVQIASGSEVEISMPIPAAQLSVAPATIALWYYDYDEARWIEEGSAQKIGNQYVGKVKHFSFWNCDAFSATVYMEGQVFLRDDQHPLEGAVVRLTVVSNGFQGFGYTNAEGWFGGAVPKDYAMKLEVLFPDQCGGQVLFTQDIGPFSNDVVLPPIIITNLSPQSPAVTVGGHLLDCDNQPVTNGYVKIQVGNSNIYTAFPDQDGAFEINVFNCVNSSSGSAIAYDLTNYLESPVQNFDPNTDPVDLGNITVCNALSEYIQYTLDGQDITHIEPQALLEGNTTYVYAYDSTNTGGKSVNFNFTNSGQTGTFPLNYLNIWPPGDTIAVLNVNTVVTQYGNVGEPIIGTFSGTYQSNNGTNHTISGSYRILRDQ